MKNPAAGRLADVVAGLSLATDLGTAMPAEHGIRTCIVAMGLGEVVGLNRAELADLFYLALLRMLGCTSTSVQAANAMGDELAAGRGMEGVDFGRNAETALWMLRHVGERQP